MQNKRQSLRLEPEGREDINIKKNGDMEQRKTVF